ncbi:hypothetical protein BRD22_02650 [Halobacteriales archaeon SW_8_68_21]|nr:MAG: hypothetical protein BRD22_02650 [Halobacteriales archaeon SW_8_68_21]
MSDDESTDINDTDESAAVGVKLGSTRTVLDVPDGRGGRERHSVLTCLATYEDAITGEEKVLFGEEAAVEYPDRVRFMLRSGLPEDDDSVAGAERFFEAVVDAHDVPEDSAVVYAVPTIDNEAGVENLKSVIEGSAIGGIETRSYPESLCGAIPAYGEQLSPFSTGSVTGNEVDRRIVAAVEEESQGRVHIDRTTAREYKEEHADVYDFEPFTDVIQQPGGGSHEFTVDRGVREPVDRYIDEAADIVANEFLPELANDHMKPYQLALGRPIAATGGMACIPGLTEEFEKRLSDELDRDVEVVSPDDPATAAAEGAARIAARLV